MVHWLIRLKRERAIKINMPLLIRLQFFTVIAFLGLALPTSSFANDVKKRGNSLSYIRNEFQTNLDIYRTDGSDAECFNLIRARQHATDAIELGDKSLAQKFNTFNARISDKCRLAPFRMPGINNPNSEEAKKRIEGENCATYSELIAMSDRGRVESNCNGGYMFIKRE